jgi:hypothetical protein
MLKGPLVPKLVGAGKGIVSLQRGAIRWARAGICGTGAAAGFMVGGVCFERTAAGVVRTAARIVRATALILPQHAGDVVGIGDNLQVVARLVDGLNEFHHRIRCLLKGARLRNIELIEP